MTSFRPLNVSRALVASVLAASATSVFHERGLDFITISLVVLAVSSLSIVHRLRPSYYWRATNWLFEKPLDPDANLSQEILWQLSRINFVVGGASLTLMAGSFNTLIPILVYLIGCGAALLLTLKHLITAKRVQAAAPLVPLSFVSTIRKQIHDNQRIFVTAGPNVELSTPNGLSSSETEISIADATMLLHLHIGSLIHVHGIDDPYLHAIVELLGIAPTHLICERTEAVKLMPGDMIILVESPIFMDDVDPTSITSEILSKRGRLTASLIEISR